jgi:beta-lactamase class D
MKILFCLACLLFSRQVTAEEQSIALLFARAGVTGTMVIESLRTGRTFTHNDSRAAQRFSSASTFKIFNTLISLQERAILGKDDLIVWDGKIHEGYADWNHDQTLASAFKVSCVWCYQEFARRVGADKYRQYIRDAGYGELTEPFALTTFWLDGALTISAQEQVAFLKKVYRRTLPFSSANYDTLREIMLVENTPTYTLRAKTGWAGSTQQIGWYVGYVETDEDVWFFATNLDIGNNANLPLRQELTRQALQGAGILH